MFNGKIKAENQQLAEKNKQLEAEVAALKARLAALDADSLEKVKEHCAQCEAQLQELDGKIAAKKQEYAKAEADVQTLLGDKTAIEDRAKVLIAIEEKQKLLTEVEDELLMESYALYSPRYAFKNSDEYRVNMEQLRARQREMLRTKKAVNYVDGWEIDGSKELGEKLNNDNIQKLIRGFNAECDIAVRNVRFNNFDRMEQRIRGAFDTLNELNEVSQVSITEEYLQLKLDELAMAYEYQQKLQKEADDKRTLREQQREDAAARREIDLARRRLNEEKAALQKEQAEAAEQAATHDPEEYPEFTTRLHEIEDELAQNEKEAEALKKRINDRKSGFVYVLSNIGSFGEGVFRVGMTRRLDTEAFVDEFNTGAVPFHYDVHAMLYSDEAKDIVDAFRARFAHQRLNWENEAKDFYCIDASVLAKALDELFGRSVDMVQTAPAQQYRNSIRLAREQADE